MSPNTEIPGQASFDLGESNKNSAVKVIDEQREQHKQDLALTHQADQLTFFMTNEDPNKEEVPLIDFCQLTVREGRKNEGQPILLYKDWVLTRLKNTFKEEDFAGLARGYRWRMQQLKRRSDILKGELDTRLEADHDFGRQISDIKKDIEDNKVKTFALEALIQLIEANSEPSS